MKKILFVSMMSVLSSPVGAEDKSSGCGLGWAVSKKKSLLSSSTRSTTNGLTFNTCGMTSGTSGCAKHSIVQKEKEAVHFAEANYDSLRLDVAQGDGVYLDAFASTMGCSGGALPAFKEAVEGWAPNLLQHDSPVNFVHDLKKQVDSHKTLSRACVIS